MSHVQNCEASCQNGRTQVEVSLPTSGHGHGKCGGGGECRHLLDEPASALDLRNQDRVLGLIRRLADSGLAAIFTTHQPNHAIAVADTVLLMLPDAPAAFGPCPEAITDERLARLYGIAVRTVTFEAEGRSRRAVVPFYSSNAKSLPPEKAR